ncbi:ABC transporter permease subunit [Limosilactobacillus gastricus]|uniref:D-methionine ABC superfamily ATP binding cassette transporter, permease protein n=1 Tax=Limosilactobacillus gastricus DSM 16045 TaxID=1423749 RepID=A0A0R1VC46_9LACO|nr:methionine ABC transporter permease [Limosilactobacillus gastricus]KRM03096.1 D-methionine ABC superfamily ATP binding cassette transporter, permease protein [Limosilactobacillus gastricus DSM 16045]QGF40567.1 ABC transporter permease subunit [Limosilactobacillus gastricus]
MSWLSQYFPNVVTNQEQFVSSIWQTLYMVCFSAILTGIIGLFFGIILSATEEGHILSNQVIYQILDKIVNIMRSIPFIILLALLVPFTRWLIGTSIGTTAALVPLTLGCAPFYARQIQNALSQIDPGLIEAAKSMGLSNFEIIVKVYLREGLGEIIRVSIVTLISLIGLTAMAGAVGAGGLGDIAITLGYNQFENDITLAATLIILVMVFIIQFIGDLLIHAVEH